MKVSFPLLLFLIATLAPASFALEPHTILTPEITIRETVYDFKTLLEGEKVIHTFVIENTGNAPLVIEEIKTTCGCTTADYTKGEIAPGAEGKVTLQVDTKGYGGRQITKDATVVTNDPNIKDLKLQITGNVAVFAEIDPKTIKLVGSPDETVRDVVRIVPTEAYPFHIVGEPENGKDTYRCILEEKDGVYFLTAENLAKEDTFYFDTVVLKTDHPEYPEIKIRVLGKITTKTRTDK